MASLRYVTDDTTLNPANGRHEPVEPYWLAADDDCSYDASGPTPLDAMATLAHELELAVRAAADPDGPTGGPRAELLKRAAELLDASMPTRHTAAWVERKDQWLTEWSDLEGQ